MSAENRSKLVRMTVRNVGCIGNNPLSVELDRVVCFVGKNNAGKSTLLRSYELAKGSAAFSSSDDRHHHAANDEPSEILLDVHIPDGIGNVDSKWKIDRDGLRIVRSRWQWSAPLFEKVRSTWDPNGGDDGSGGWAEDGKAGGADNVFGSRLPRPLRIGSLDDAEKTEELLLSFALSPLVASLEKERRDAESSLSRAIASVSSQVNDLGSRHEMHFNEISKKITEGFRNVFPGLNVRLDVGATQPNFRIADLIKNGSSIRVTDGSSETALRQQGTGARRAIFWAMLQVHNELARDREIRDEYGKRLAKEITDEEKKKNSTKKSSTTTPEDSQRVIDALKARQAAHDQGAPIPTSPDDPALPGYLLLIDEPENALHPMAARAAQRHLYRLSESPDWQVMLTTHSPYFVNPFEDHTTIVRIERETSGSHRPRIYRSSSVQFEDDEKSRLQALQQIDPTFSEIFFGSYPVLVEGDTEHAAFIASITETQHDLMNRVAIIRARGKAILVPLIKVLRNRPEDDVLELGLKFRLGRSGPSGRAEVRRGDCTGATARA